MKYSLPLSLLGSPPTGQSKVWSLFEMHNYVLLLFAVRLFSGPWFTFHFFFLPYLITFILELEMSHAFKTNIISFISFISFWKVMEKIPLLGILVEPKLMFQSLFDIFYGNILISCSKARDENLSPFKKFWQIFKKNWMKIGLFPIFSLPVRWKNKIVHSQNFIFF